MRIIAGKHKGRKIEVGKQATHVRPTSSFTREAIFNILSHGAYAVEGKPCFYGKNVADLCSGTGAFGLEALSRGAETATFVDMDHHALLAAKANAERFGEDARASFVRANITHLPPARGTYALLFLDPPYFGNMINPALKSLLAGGWIAADTLIIIEHDARETPDIPPELEKIDERKYGRASVQLLKLTASH
jgi:16S rRNA (guanine966-N2)-methyltransferase